MISLQTILIVGASTSAVEISRDIGPHVKKLYLSARDTVRTGIRERMFHRLYAGAEVVPEIEELQHLDSLEDGIQNGKILFKNGSTLTGVDEVRDDHRQSMTLWLMHLFHRSSLRLG